MLTGRLRRQERDATGLHGTREEAAQGAVLVAHRQLSLLQILPAPMWTSTGSLRKLPATRGKGGPPGTRCPNTENRDWDSGLGSHSPLEVSGSS